MKWHVLQKTKSNNFLHLTSVPLRSTLSGEKYVRLQAVASTKNDIMCTPLQKAAKVLVSGEYSRRRGYLTSVIVTLNGLAVTGCLSIWAFFVNCEHLVGDSSQFEVFSLEVALASAVSSILIGLWRLYVRYLDGEIIKLFPALYICERSLMPKDICTITLPKSKQPLEQINGSDNLSWDPVRNKDFGGRGHHQIDFIFAAYIILSGVVSLIVAYSHTLITIKWMGLPHSIGLMLIGNLIGLSMVLLGWLLWRNKEVKWPCPRNCFDQKAKSTAEPENSADPKGRAAD